MSASSTLVKRSPNNRGRQNRPRGAAAGRLAMCDEKNRAICAKGDSTVCQMGRGILQGGEGTRYVLTLSARAPVPERMSRKRGGKSKRFRLRRPCQEIEGIKRQPPLDHPGWANGTNRRRYTKQGAAGLLDDVCQEM